MFKCILRHIQFLHQVSWMCSTFDQGCPFSNILLHPLPTIVYVYLLSELDCLFPVSKIESQPQVLLNTMGSHRSEINSIALLIKALHSSFGLTSGRKKLYLKAIHKTMSGDLQSHTILGTVKLFCPLTLLVSLYRARNRRRCSR